jgi:hypothetical protein
MNYSKLICFGAAGIALFTTTARAETLSDLKLQIEALNARLAQIESAPSVPAGYNLMSISKVEGVEVLDTDNASMFGTTGTAIAVLPTADVPASTEIVWTGYVSAALTYNDTETAGFDANGDGDFLDAGEAAPVENDALDIKSKAGLNVNAKTETAVGEVGVSIALLAEVATTGGINRTHDSAVATDGFKGYWKITPELELSGGVFSSATKNGQGWKGKADDQYANDDPTGHYGTNTGNDPAQIRLTYKSGDIAVAIAAEDYNNVANKSTIAVAGEFKYSGDDISFELNSGYFNNADSAIDDNWTVNAGAGFKFAGIGLLSAAIGVGEDRHTVGNSDQYIKGSLYASFDLSDSVRFDAGVGYRDYKARPDMWAFGGGLYYSPVSQLTIGIEADYQDEKGSFSSSLRAVDQLDVALVSVYQF